MNEVRMSKLERALVEKDYALAETLIEQGYLPWRTMHEDEDNTEILTRKEVPDWDFSMGGLHCVYQIMVLDPGMPKELMKKLDALEKRSYHLEDIFQRNPIQHLKRYPNPKALMKLKENCPYFWNRMGKHPMTIPNLLELTYLNWSYEIELQTILLSLLSDDEEALCRLIWEMRDSFLTEDIPDLTESFAVGSADSFLKLINNREKILNKIGKQKKAQSLFAQYLIFEYILCYLQRVEIVLKDSEDMEDVAHRNTSLAYKQLIHKAVSLVDNELFWTGLVQNAPDFMTYEATHLFFAQEYLWRKKRFPICSSENTEYGLSLLYVCDDDNVAIEKFYRSIQVIRPGQMEYESVLNGEAPNLFITEKKGKTRARKIRNAVLSLDNQKEAMEGRPQEEDDLKEDGMEPGRIEGLLGDIVRFGTEEILAAAIENGLINNAVIPFVMQLALKNHKHIYMPMLMAAKT